jgi:hypothetical protein
VATCWVFWVGSSWVLSLGFKLGYLCILSCVFKGVLRFFFDIYNITYKKNKGILVIVIFP